MDIREVLKRAVEGSLDRTNDIEKTAEELGMTTGEVKEVLTGRVPHIELPAKEGRTLLVDYARSSCELLVGLMYNGKYVRDVATIGPKYTNGGRKLTYTAYVWGGNRQWSNENAF